MYFFPYAELTLINPLGLVPGVLIGERPNTNPTNYNFFLLNFTYRYTKNSSFYKLQTKRRDAADHRDSRWLALRIGMATSLEGTDQKLGTAPPGRRLVQEPGAV